MTEETLMAMLGGTERRVRLSGNFRGHLKGRTGRLVEPYDSEDMAISVQLDGGGGICPVYIHAIEPAPRPWLPNDPIIDPDIGTLRYLACPVPSAPGQAPGTPPDSRWFATEHRGFGAVSVVNVADAVRADGEDRGWADGKGEGQGAEVPVLPDGQPESPDYEAITYRIHPADSPHVIALYEHLSLDAHPMPHPSGDGRMPIGLATYGDGEFRVISVSYPPASKPPATTLADLADAWLADMGDAAAREAFHAALFDAGHTVSYPARLYAGQPFEHRGAKFMAAWSSDGVVVS